MNLKLIAFKGIRWNVVGTVVAAVGGLLQIYILVRYLEKSDFGLMAIVNTTITFSMIFIGFGIDNSIIHKEKINSIQLSTLYWLTLTLGVIMTILIYFLSPFIAFFFGEEELELILKTIAIIFFLNSTGYPFKAKLSKELCFRELAIIGIASNLCSLVVILYLAIRGFGVYSLVYGTILRSIIDMIFSFWYGFKNYTLKCLFTLKEVHFFLRFGFFQMGENILNFLSKQVDVLIIGKVLGMEMLGIYDVIKKLLQRPVFMINPIITNVSFPLMSKFQNNVSKLTKTYLRQLNYICALNFPVYIFLFVNAELFIELMFGLDWVTYKNVFRIITLNFLLASSLNPIGSLLMAKGKVDLSFYWNLSLFIIGPAVIYSGVRWNITGVSLATFILYLFLILPNYYILVKAVINPGFNLYFRQILLPLVQSIVMGGFCYLGAEVLYFSLILQILILSLIAAVIYGLQTYWFNQIFWTDLLLLIKRKTIADNE